MIVNLGLHWVCKKEAGSLSKSSSGSCPAGMVIVKLFCSSHLCQPERVPISSKRSSGIKCFQVADALCSLTKLEFCPKTFTMDAKSPNSFLTFTGSIFWMTWSRCSGIAVSELFSQDSSSETESQATSYIDPAKQQKQMQVLHNIHRSWLHALAHMITHDTYQHYSCPSILANVREVVSFVARTINGRVWPDPNRRARLWSHNPFVRQDETRLHADLRHRFSRDETQSDTKKFAGPFLSVRGDEHWMIATGGLAALAMERSYLYFRCKLHFISSKLFTLRVYVNEGISLYMLEYETQKSHIVLVGKC